MYHYAACLLPSYIIDIICSSHYWHQVEVGKAKMGLLRIPDEILDLSIVVSRFPDS